MAASRPIGREDALPLSDRVRPPDTKSYTNITGVWQQTDGVAALCVHVIACPTLQSGL
jgi:hypothetical protein